MVVVPHLIFQMHSCNHMDILLFQLVSLNAFSFLKISLLLLYLQLLCQWSLNIHLLLSFSSVSSYCVMDTSLSNEAVIKLKPCFTLRLSNPMLINFSEFCAITSTFFLYLISRHSELLSVHHNFSCYEKTQGF